MLHLWDGKHITILYNFYISIEWIKTIFVFVFIASKLNETLFNRVTTYLFRQNIVSCEKSRFYAKNYIFFNFRGRARRVRPPGSAPVIHILPICFDSAHVLYM
jgi:CRISPR/Cas system-associated protein Cas5 (RAMP superfamily)